MPLYLVTIPGHKESGTTFWGYPERSVVRAHCAQCAIALVNDGALRRDDYEAKLINPLGPAAVLVQDVPA